VVNHAAGRGDSRDGIAFAQIEAILQASMERVRAIVEGVCA